MNYKVIFCSFITALSVSCVHAKDKSTSGISELKKISVDNLERSYKIYKPAKQVKNSPLVIFLHGGLGNADHSEKNYAFNTLADENGFIVAYPNGNGLRFFKNRRTWNAGTCCGKAKDDNIDDVHFIKEMIEQIKKNESIDPKRIYLTGMSNGAMLTYRLICTIPEYFAAATPVAGTLAISTCEKGADIPVLHIHGTHDENVPYEGGLGPKSIGGGTRLSVLDTMKELSKNRNCQDPKVQTLPDQDKVLNYECKKGANLKVHIIHQGKHEWPLGNSGTSALNATLEAWNFMKGFQK